MSTALNEFPGWYIEFQAALLRQAPRPGEIDKMTAERWTSNQSGLKKNLADCLLSQELHRPCQTDQVQSSARSGLLLDLVGVVEISTTSLFVAKDRFVINTKSNAPVKISYLDDSFMAWFLDGDGKIEGPINKWTLCYHKLLRPSVNSPIITKLGGKMRVETTLSGMYFLMETQKNGEHGILLVNGNANIFYIRDQDNVLCVVYVCWIDGGWSVYACSIEGLIGWHIGRQVFSRNSVLKSSEPLAPAKA